MFRPAHQFEMVTSSDQLICAADDEGSLQTHLVHVLKVILPGGVSYAEVGGASAVSKVHAVEVGRARSHSDAWLLLGGGWSQCSPRSQILKTGSEDATEHAHSPRSTTTWFGVESQRQGTGRCMSLWVPHTVYSPKGEVRRGKDTSLVVDPRIMECFGHYHKTPSPEEGPAEVDQALECVPYPTGVLLLRK
ncbi:uncharacterized protein LOC120787787 isoform X2 [Xiphias gladius]|uniref:uncharacterized protein LOC120787787 isoform X2 n=1 Tax=Xiphias gladius TaxID=8245 RepID=UPI001A985BA9|nr:uncharacterized protein LOC120787787 isoform X2 [Xiphias gladius]